MTISVKKDIADLWRFRLLIKELSGAYIKLRHAGSVLGFLWTLLNPVFYIATYWFVFSYVIKMGLPNYPMFLIPGYLAWNFTFSGVLGASESIIHGKHLITKIAFPVEILTIASVIVSFIDFILAMAIYIFAVFAADVFFEFNFSFNWLLAYLPFILFFHFLFTLGTAFIAASAAVYFKDLPKLINVFGNLIFFLTPIFYSIEYIPDNIRKYILLNPAALIVGAYHNIMYYAYNDAHTLVLFAGASTAVLLIGYLIFNKYKSSFAELS